MMNNKKIVLIDIDGVACAHAEAICNWVNEMYSLKSRHEDVKSWNYDFGPITFTEAVDVCYPDEFFILSMKVTPGFKEFLNTISDKVIVKFASSRKSSMCATCRWIEINFGSFELHFASPKADLDFDYLIDDSEKECMETAKRGKNAFLITRPWNNNEGINRKIEGYKNILRVLSFDEIKGYLGTC